MIFKTEAKQTPAFCTLQLPVDRLFDTAENMLQPVDRVLGAAGNMLQPIGKKAIALAISPRGMQIAAVAAGSIVVVKIASAAVDRIHERRQGRQLKKLKKQVAELEERISKLEKAE